MPELPEVETVRRALRLELVGRRITAVRGRAIAMRRPLEVENLRTVLPGRRFLEPRRRGKFLLLDTGLAGISHQLPAAAGDAPHPEVFSRFGVLDVLSSTTPRPSGRKPHWARHLADLATKADEKRRLAGSLLIHLGMSGIIQLVPAAAPLRAHTHLILELDDGREFRFVDPRRFGLAAWLEPGAEADDPSLRTLGMEPLDPNLPQSLPAIVRRRRAPIKSLLLDQHLVAGIGNIYAAEALWRAGIHPRRAGNRISVARLAVLATTIQEVLAEAIAEGGTTLRDFATPDGSSGYFAVSLQVYGRQGKPCVRCGATLRAEAIGGRTTAWCPRCQR